MIYRTLVCMCCAVLLHAPAAWAQEEEADMTATAYQTVNVRSGPDTRFEIIGQVGKGDIVTVTGREGELARWLYVLLPEGPSGWVPGYSLIVEADVSRLPIVDGSAESAAATGEVRVIAYGRVNVRSGPGMAYEIVNQLDINAQATATARSTRGNDWLYIQAGGVEGWVAYFTVTVQGDPNVLPVRVPDATGQALVRPSALIVTRFNTHLRDNPSEDAPIVLLLPFDTEVTPLARTDTADWLYVGYETTNAWGATELFVIPEDYLMEIPVYSSEVDYSIATDGVVVVTPEVTLEVVATQAVEITETPAAP